MRRVKKTIIVALAVLALVGALATPAFASVYHSGTMKLETGTTSTVFYGKVGCGYSWERCQGYLYFYRQGAYVGYQNCYTTYSNQCYGAKPRYGLSCGALLIYADVWNAGGSRIRGWFSTC